MEKKISYEQLFQFTQQVFMKMGCPPEQAKTATETLVAADLRGIDYMVLPVYLVTSGYGRLIV